VSECRSELGNSGRLQIGREKHLIGACNLIPDGPSCAEPAIDESQAICDRPRCPSDDRHRDPSVTDNQKDAANIAGCLWREGETSLTGLLENTPEDGTRPKFIARLWVGSGITRGHF
jgi:hypothetical protein